MILVPPEPVVEAMHELGFAGNETLARGLGVLLPGCTILCAVPSTAPHGGETAHEPGAPRSPLVIRAMISP